MLRTTVLGAALAAATLVAPVRAQCSNDDCAGAIPLVFGLNGPFDNTCATTSNPAWPCATVGNDLWFSYFHIGAPFSTVDVNTCTNTAFDTAIEVFDIGGCSSLSSIACNDDACGQQSRVTWVPRQNQLYLIRVGGVGGAQGSFSVRVTTDGSFSSNGGGCGGTAITASSNAPSGLPEIGSTVMLSLNAAGAFQAIWLGLPQTPVAICAGCEQCCSMVQLFPLPSVALPIPNTVSIAGASISVQGIDVFMSGGLGCPLGGTFSVTLSDCVAIAIGCGC